MGIVVALDGFSATGKRTLGVALKEKFNYAYLDTGALYRAVAYVMRLNHLDVTSEEQALQTVKTLSFQQMQGLQNDPGIRTDENSKATSIVAAMPQVRGALLDFQRQVAYHPTALDGTPLKGAILDGRDIGTVVCPDAQIKLFLTARPEIRALRRFKELQLTQKDVILENVLAALQERDARDASRKTAPTKPAEDAYILDTSDLTPEEVWAATLKEMKKRGVF